MAGSLVQGPSVSGENLEALETKPELHVHWTFELHFAGSIKENDSISSAREPSLISRSKIRLPAQGLLTRVFISTHAPTSCNAFGG